MTRAASIESIHGHFESGFEKALAKNDPAERRIGVEHKFPLVNSDGSAADFDAVCALWDYLRGLGWRPVTDSMTGKVVGAAKAGERNDTVASCETGFCKPEFSLAHVADLFELERATEGLCDTLRRFSEDRQVYFLGYGIQPVTPPCGDLMMKKTRTSVWEGTFGPDRIIPPAEGGDVCLFTVNAASHVHLSVTHDEAVAAVNVLNGFAGAQIALTAHSNVWKGRIDPEYKCAAEKLWDWWILEPGRVGVPEKRFANLADYVDTVSSFRPVYVKRDGQPIVLKRYGSFAGYFASGKAVGEDVHGEEHVVVPETADIDLHSTCYWYNARLSRYYTVENRANDQQPPDELTVVPALTLGLVSALAEAAEEVESHDWQLLRDTREEACRRGLEGRVGDLELRVLACRMVDLAQLGLLRRGLGEEEFLAPLVRRIRNRKCPADTVARLFERGGIEALVDARRI